MRLFPHFAVTLAVACHVCGATSTSAHDLPISNMMIVAAEDMMHVELMLNAAELSFFTEVDRDKNGLLDPAELRAQSDQVSQLIVDCFSFRIDGSLIAAAVHGVVPEIGTHHLTIRAHYAGDAREAPVSVESRLVAITRSSHVIEVVLQRPDERLSARLDARDPDVYFDYERADDMSEPMESLSDSGKAPRTGTTLLIALATLLGSLLLFRGKKR